MGQPYNRSGREHNIWRHEAGPEHSVPPGAKGWSHGSACGSSMYRGVDDQRWWGLSDGVSVPREPGGLHMLAYECGSGSAASPGLHASPAASVTALGARGLHPMLAGPRAGAPWSAASFPALSEANKKMQGSARRSHLVPFEQPSLEEKALSPGGVGDFRSEQWPPPPASRPTAPAYMGTPSTGQGPLQSAESYEPSPHLAAYMLPGMVSHCAGSSMPPGTEGWADTLKSHGSLPNGSGSLGPHVGRQLLSGAHRMHGDLPSLYPQSDGFVDEMQMERLSYELPAILERASVESRRSQFDKYGKLRCLSCNRMLGAYAALEQHLASKHEGHNSEQRKYYEATLMAKEVAGAMPPPAKQRPLFFQDFVAAATRKNAPPPPGQQVLAAYLREPVSTDYGRGPLPYPSAGSRGFGRGDGSNHSLNPNPASSAPLTQRRGKESVAPKKKKLSALKKVILRERAEKAAIGAAGTGGSSKASAGDAIGGSATAAGALSKESAAGGGSGDDDEKLGSTDVSKLSASSCSSGSIVSSPKGERGAASASYTDDWLVGKQPASEASAGASLSSAPGAAASAAAGEEAAALKRALDLQATPDGESKDSTMRQALQEFIRAQQALVAAVEGQLSAPKGPAVRSLSHSPRGSSHRSSHSSSPPLRGPGPIQVLSEQALSDDIDRLQTYLESFSVSPDSAPHALPAGLSGATSPRPRLSSPGAGERSVESYKHSSTSSRASQDGDGRLAGDKAARPNTYIGPDVNIRYCKQVITSELNRVTTELLKELLRFQERAKARDPIKAKKKRRLVVGLREVSRAVRSGRAKCIIVAPNIEAIVSEGGLDFTLNEILKQAEEKSVTVVFALTKSRIAQAFGRRVRMSTVAICEFDGANDLYKEMVAHAESGRRQWLAAHSDADTPASAAASAPDIDSAGGHEQN